MQQSLQQLLRRLVEVVYFVACWQGFSIQRENVVHPFTKQRREIRHTPHSNQQIRGSAILSLHGFKSDARSIWRIRSSDTDLIFLYFDRSTRLSSGRVQ